MGEAGAAHARPTLERLDLESRIVGERHHERGVGNGARLLDGVLRECLAVLDHVRRFAEDVVDAQYFDGQRGQERA